MPLSWLYFSGVFFGRAYMYFVVSEATYSY